jgi:uncharacterized membrane protein YraQ (UPF0718 family)
MAIVFSVTIGFLMHLIFKKGEKKNDADESIVIPSEQENRKFWQNSLYFISMLGVLIFANWPAPSAEGNILSSIYHLKWFITGGFLIVLVFSLWRFFTKDELFDWTDSSWTFAKQIMPLLLGGVFIAGFLLGGPDGGQGVIPAGWISSMVGGNSIGANLFASIAGALMYFATLTEVPILKGLLNAGMGKGPALALLLAGPALSLPNMLVIRTVMGTKKTLVFVVLVVVLSSAAGSVFGMFF